MIRPSGTPTARAASTNSRAFSERNSPRMIRASHIQPNDAEEEDDC